MVNLYNKKKILINAKKKNKKQHISAPPKIQIIKRLYRVHVMKKLNSQLNYRKCRSTSDPEFSTSTRPSEKTTMITLVRKHQNPMYWHPQFYKNLSETFIGNPAVSKTSSLESNCFEFPLIPTPKTPKNPKEILHKSLTKLKNSQWNDSVAALQNIVQISRFNPQLLEKYMPEICKGLTALLKTLRSTAARTACQAANELFMNVKSFKGPEFDKLIHTLLQKSADTNKDLRNDILEALDSMIIHLPPAQSIKILLHRRIASFNLNARRLATKLLACLFSTTGSELTITLSEDSKIRLVQAAIRFLQDDCNDIKFHGMHLVTMLMQEKGFENIFKTKVDLSTLNKILENIKNSFG